MNLLTKAIGISLAIGIASTEAHAGSIPIGTTTTPTGGALYLEVFSTDAATPYTELVNLNASLTSILPATGALTPNSPTGNFTVGSNPTGSAGSVLQIDYGVIPGFSSTFTNLGTTDFMVLAAQSGSSASLTVSPSTAAVITANGYQAAALTATGIAANWNIDGTLTGPGYAIDLTGGKTWSAGTFSQQFGALGLAGSDFSAGVGTAIGFYNIAGSGRTFTSSQYANATGAGFWFLSNSGDLTYNVPTAAAPVPLPAAAWLLISGIAGLGTVGRRRRQIAA